MLTARNWFSDVVRSHFAIVCNDDHSNILHLFKTNDLSGLVIINKQKKENKHE
jgi:hypothetical protein